MNILAVDDTSVILLSLKRVLEKRGHEVATAGNGSEALAILDEFDAHLVISDLRMPDMSGVDLCRRIRERRSEAGRPVPAFILLTAVPGFGARSSRPELPEGFEDELVAVLEKPIDRQALLAAVERVPCRDENAAR